MKKLFAVLLAISTIIMFGCKAKTPAVASSSSSDLDIQVSAPISSDTSSIADSSEASSSALSPTVSSKTVSSQTKAITTASSSKVVSSASSTSNNDKLIADENARHAAALKCLEDTYNANMALFTERDKLIAQRNTLQESLKTETDETEKADLNTQINSLTSTINDYYFKMLAIVFPNLNRQNYQQYFASKRSFIPAETDLGYAIQEKYKKDVAAENNKHEEIMKQLG